MIDYDVIIALLMASCGLVVNYVCSKAVKDRYKFEEDKTIIHSFFSDINIAIMYIGIYIMALVSGSLSVSIFEIPYLLFYTVASYILGEVGFELGKKIYKVFNHYLPRLIRIFNTSVDSIISKINSFKIGNVINSKSGSSQELLRLQELVANLSLQLEQRRNLLVAGPEISVVADKRSKRVAAPKTSVAADNSSKRVAAPKTSVAADSTCLKRSRGRGRQPKC